MIFHKHSFGWNIELPCLNCSQYGCSGSISIFVYECDGFDNEADALNYAEELRKEKQAFCHKNV
jgi:hypothetical protein